MWYYWLSTCQSSIKARFVQCTTPPELWFSAVLPESPWASLLHLWPVSFGGRPFPGRFSVVPYSFYLWMMGWTVFHQMFKALRIILESDPAFNLSMTSLTCLVCSLDFMMLFAFQYALRNPLRCSQNSCICNEIKLHTGGLSLAIRPTFSHSAINRQLLKAIELNALREKVGWILLCAPLFCFFFPF